MQYVLGFMGCLAFLIVGCTDPKKLPVEPQREVFGIEGAWLHVSTVTEMSDSLGVILDSSMLVSGEIGSTNAGQIMIVSPDSVVHWWFTPGELFCTRSVHTVALSDSVWYESGDSVTASELGAIAVEQRWNVAADTLDMVREMHFDAAPHNPNMPAATRTMTDHIRYVAYTGPIPPPEWPQECVSGHG